MTFTPTDAANYTTATATVDDQRAEGDADDHAGRIPADITYGTRAERDAAERDRQRAGHLRLHPGRRDRAERRHGQTLSVTFTPTDTANYTTATKTVSINVLKATPTITWPNPAGHHVRHGA